MSTVLYSISPFLSAGTNRTNPKQCSFSHLRKSSAFPHPLKKPFTIFASSRKASSPREISFRLPKWKEGTKVFKPKLTNSFFQLDKMVREGYTPDSSEAQDLLLDLCGEGMLLKSVRVMELILESNAEPDQFTRTFMIETLSSIGAHEYALKLLDKMLQRGLTLDDQVYDSLTDSLCRQAFSRQSLHQLEKLINEGLVPCNTHGFAALLEAAYYEKGVDEAMSLMYQILKKGKPYANMVCYNIILTALCKENRVSEALELFEALSLVVIRRSLISYNILLKALCNEGRWRDAENLFDEMEKSYYPSIITYKGLIQVIANKGYPEEALQIAELIANSGFKTDGWCFNPIIARFCLENRVDMVHKVLELMQKVKCDVNEGTYLAICVLCTEDNADAAFSILEGIRKKQRLSLHQFYIKVFPYLCRKGSTFEAIQILNKLAQLGFTPNSVVISSLANGLCMEGMLEEAMEMFELRENNGIRSEVMNYNTLILGLCKAGRVDLALTVHERMILRGYKPNENTYVYIAEGIAYQDRRDLAKELLRELSLRNIVSENTVDRLYLKFCLDDV
ncbi:hypothetical protein LUZ60_005111 [Juncus effusus]|nr:hypothetical protein LUZ60_005111 [Juncus effusus]